MLQKLIDKIEKLKSYDKPMSFMSGINQAIETIKKHEPDFEDAIKKAYSDGQINIVNIIREQLPQFPLPKTIEEIRKIQDGEEPNDDAQDYYNQNFKK